MSKSILVMEGASACFYSLAIPNYEKLEFEPTRDVISVHDIIPSGFPRKSRYLEPYFIQKNARLTKNVVDERCLRKAADDLTTKTKEAGADYLLIRVLRNVNSGDRREIIIEQQMLLKR